MTRRMEKSNAGMAMLLAIMFIAVALVILNTVALRLKSDLRQSESFVESNSAFNAAEFALARSVADLQASGSGCLGTDQWAGLAAGKAVTAQAGMPGGIALPAYGEAGVVPIKTSDGSAEYWTLVLNWAVDGIDNNGDGVVDGPEEAGFYSIYAAARSGSTGRRIEAIYKASEGPPRSFARVSWRELF